MTKTLIALTALFAVCAAFGQSSAADSPGMLSGDDTVVDVDSTAKGAGLESFLELDEGQIESLLRLEQQFEDDLFPLVRDAWEKEWQLRQLYRSDPPDETSEKMLHQQLAALHEQVQSLGARHREQSRGLLRYKQLTALDRLETVLELSHTAEEALCANLVEAPAHFGYDPSLVALTWGPLRSAACGLGAGFPTVFNGQLETDADETDADTGAVSISQSN